MSESPSDSLVFLRATGNLAHKTIFPSRQSMIKRGHLSVHCSRNTEVRLDHRAPAGSGRGGSLEKHIGIDAGAFDRLCGLLFAREGGRTRS